MLRLPANIHPQVQQTAHRSPVHRSQKNGQPELNALRTYGTVAKKMINFFNRQHDLGFFLDKMKVRAVMPHAAHRCVRGGVDAASVLL